MAAGTDLLSRNVELLRSRVNRHGIYGLVLSLATIVIASAVVSYQMTGAVDLDGMLLAQRENFALRLLDLLPLVFTIWGQYTGTVMAYHAGAIILEQTDDLRAETTAWKKKSVHDATHDSLTGLPNRVQFYDVLQQAIHAAGREDRAMAVLFIDLDGFKEVNDAFGPQNGDLILKHAATRLMGLIPQTDTVARMGGDEFALLIMDVPSENVAVGVAQRIHKALETPFELSRTRIEVSASIGIACFPAHGTDADTLVQRAEAAMSAAKRTQEGYAGYTAGLALDNPRRLMLMTELRRAVEEGRLELYFQPKIEIRSGRVTSAEALVRWTHPQHGRISPQEFVPLAERTRLIRPLSNWVLRTGVRQLAEWRRAGLEISVSINISTRDLNDPELAAMISGLLSEQGVETHWLTLEITESSVMADAARSLEILKRLHAMQLRISIDDFGTGYSSLAYLSRLPVHEMKIDKAFVLGMIGNRSDRLIVDAAIDLGHNLGLQVVAEGVENKEILDYLRDKGCDIAQGYFVSQPLPAPQFIKWLQSGRRLKGPE
ncbi:MAG: EAL domain-containing protein [Gammaproteobacteria bacterium]|nr:EAL domain-containing protein [Gammaproteobacteria bacterium]